MFNFNTLTKRWRGLDRIQIARSSDIRQQIFSQDYFIGNTLAFPEYPSGTEPYILDMAAGDYDTAESSHAFKLVAGLPSQENTLAITIETSRTQYDILNWYNSNIKGIRFAYQITDTCGQTSAYNPVKIELNSIQSTATGSNRCTLSLQRTTLVRLDEPNLDRFMTAIICDTDEILSPSAGYSIAATAEVTEDLFSTEFSDEFD